MFTFSIIPIAITRNGSIPPSIKNTYNILRSFCNIHNHMARVYVSTLAKAADRSTRTIRAHLNWLINEGFIIRKLRKSPSNPKWNLASDFIILHWDDNGDDNSENSGMVQKISVPPEENFREDSVPEILRERENQNLTLTGRVNELSENSDNSASLSAPTPTPSDETQPTLPENPKPSNQAVKVEYDLTDVPDIMRHAVKYLLTETGRPSITPNERKIILEILEKQHTPERVMKEIDKGVERFKRLRRKLKQLTFSYIGEILGNQTSLKPRKKTRTRNTDTSKTAPSPVQEEEIMPDVSAPIMPVEEAEKVIAEYAPAVKPEEPLPVAFQEFLERIATRDYELCEEYIATLPVDENGLTVFTEENSGMLMPCWITPEEYLRLKFPEATEEELRSDYGGTYDSYSEFQERDKRDIEQALEIDYACATCTDPDHCQLPSGCKKGGSRLSVALKKDIRGRRYVQVVGGAVIRCKHGHKEQNSPEFESRLKRSGLSDRQQKHTFTAYEHVGQQLEIVSAKAMSILAAKEQKSIVLAGKPGTGKTHLAVAIALEAMRAGRQALFRSVPEMLDELRQTLREHGDFYGAMRRLKDVPCLVLDDLGKEKTTQAGLDYLYQIIDYRYRNGKQTVITTNALTMSELKNPYNADKIEPIMSRILEGGDWVSIQSAENYRLRKRPKAESVKAEIEPKVEPETTMCEPETLSMPTEIPATPELDSLPEDDYSPEQERQFQVADEAMKELYDELRAEIGVEPRKPKPDTDSWEDDGYEQELAERERREYERLEKLIPSHKECTPEERDQDIEYRLQKVDEMLRTYELSPAEKEGIERYKEELERHRQSQDEMKLPAGMLPAGTIMVVKPLDDGLDDDDDEDEYRLYGDTGIRGW